MREVQPQVFLIAEPAIRVAAMEAYLKTVGAGTWTTDAPTDAEKLIEFAGRACYRSWEPGLNPNVTKVREGNDVYLRNILSSGHGSVLEHAQVMWVFHNVSRVFTHELVRHRVGVGISQESLRYVRLTDLNFWLPDEIDLDAEIDKGYPVEYRKDTVREVIVSLVETAEEFQQDAAAALIKEGASFEDKKRITSFLRRFAPIGLATSIVWSCNFRTLRHVIEMRTSRHAEVEIQRVFRTVAEIARARWPNVFGDYDRNADGEYVTKARKV